MTDRSLAETLTQAAFELVRLKHHEDSRAKQDNIGALINELRAAAARVGERPEMEHCGNNILD